MRNATQAGKVVASSVWSQTSEATHHLGKSSAAWGPDRVEKSPQTAASEVRELRNAWIPMSDGRKLAARLWLPKNAEQNPVPGIFEFLPYGKAYGTSARDATTHAEFARRGYAGIRVDVAGTGESEGKTSDEYTEQEQRDALEIIDWISKQPWCSGKVGMMGISWGGFNSLQVAAHQPEALGGIIAVCSSEDRYSDDAHYMGGALIDENLVWGNNFHSYLARPPDPDIVGPQWKQMWLERLEHVKPPILKWLQSRDERPESYWQTKANDLSNIKTPVYAIGGWADAYTNSVARILHGATGPVKALIGPWAHAYPHLAAPGPRIDFIEEAVRFWDATLKDKDNGIFEEPEHRVWMQESVKPEEQFPVRAGRWVAERMDAPAVRLVEHPLDSEGAGMLAHTSAQTVGSASGKWCPFGQGTEMATDQREDDVRSLSFDLPAREERFEILGTPEVRLRLRGDQTQGNVIVRLNDVAPDGTSTRVSYGVLNLAHRHGHDKPKPMKPGEVYEVTVSLNDIAHAFPPGHQARVSISTEYWPIVWPGRKPLSIELDAEASFVQLPERAPQPHDDTLRPLPPPPSRSQGPKREVLRPNGYNREITVDPKTGESLTSVVSGGASKDETGLVIDRHHTEEFRIKEGDPLSAFARSTYDTTIGRGDWSTRVVVETEQRATDSGLRVQSKLIAWHGEEKVLERAWDDVV